jgi:uncharacterized radical SAM superfamily Fe-S cluster-containing enzyme
MTLASTTQIQPKLQVHGSASIFHELTRSICPTCRGVNDAQVHLQDNKVFMRKRCP